MAADATAPPSLALMPTLRIQTRWYSPQLRGSSVISTVFGRRRSRSSIAVESAREPASDCISGRSKRARRGPTPRASRRYTKITRLRPCLDVTERLHSRWMGSRCGARVARCSCRDPLSPGVQGSMASDRSTVYFGSHRAYAVRNHRIEFAGAAAGPAILRKTDDTTCVGAGIAVTIRPPADPRIQSRIVPPCA